MCWHLARLPTSLPLARRDTTTYCFTSCDCGSPSLEPNALEKLLSNYAGNSLVVMPSNGRLPAPGLPSTLLLNHLNTPACAPLCPPDPLRSHDRGTPKHLTSGLVPKTNLSRCGLSATLSCSDFHYGPMTEIQS